MAGGVMREANARAVNANKMDITNRVATCGPCEPPPPTREIPGLLQSLHASIDALQSAVATLRDRLEPVLPNRPSEPRNEASMPSATSQVGGIVAQAIGSLAALRTDVERLTDTLQV